MNDEVDMRYETRDMAREHDCVLPVFGVVVLIHSQAQENASDVKTKLQGKKALEDCTCVSGGKTLVAFC